ncbi:uncharacterized protein LOC130642262 [Hydractinia symbiolongicarpus]|uniref:uncharacterized protein LOC130642262 n=1 Tax=Hydractinia symbiolongicarpus TaxID=13093 RepID=UPI00254AC337|nr:uncharacterized protein LOC130642262 [Hydractinia symbiolongicarpus]
MVFNLINCLLDYKAKCEFENIDFDADKPMQYKVIRTELAKLYQNEEEVFGPVEDTSTELSQENVREMKKMIARGYQRVLEKIKDLRQGFSKAVISGTRSGCGRLVYEHYDSLKLLWSGSANTEPLPNGIDSADVNQTKSSNEMLSDHDDPTANINSVDSGEYEDPADDDNLSFSSSDQSVSKNSCTVTSTPKTTSAVPKLIDNKRKQLERKLSSAQRDTLLLREAKEERSDRKELQEMIKNSNESFTAALNNISQAMLQISETMSHSMQLMAQSFSQQAGPSSQNYESYGRRHHFQHINPNCNVVSSIVTQNNNISPIDPSGGGYYQSLMRE